MERLGGILVIIFGFYTIFSKFFRTKFGTVYAGKDAVVIGVFLVIAGLALVIQAEYLKRKKK